MEIEPRLWYNMIISCRGSFHRKERSVSEKLAVDDDLIRKNPFEFQLATIVVNGSVTREAITRKQKMAFLNTPDYCFPYCF